MKESQPRAIYLKNYRKPDYLIDTTDLNFRLYDNGAAVHSLLKFRRNPDAEDFSNSLKLDGQDLELRSLSIDGRELSKGEYELVAEQLVLENLPEQFELACETWIKPQENTCLEGLYRSSSMFCTQCEAEGFRRITYYLDRPDIMSRFTTRVEAEQGVFPVLLSNGNPVESGQLEGGRHWVKWDDPHKKPCYLFALVAGDLKWVEDHFKTMSGREVKLRIYVEPDNLDKCEHAMTSLKNAMRWDEDVYGREYDLDIFNIVAVSDFNMGAMENKGLNIFNSSCVLANPQTSTDEAFRRIESIVAHEYFHNWSGNRVTCRDWFQLSLKEGFTVFRDSEFSADMHSAAVKRIEDVNVLRTSQFAEDAGPMAHPIRPDSYIEISNFYTLTVYEKGSEVVRMLHTLLGAELFRKGSDLYFQRHDGQAVTTEDFVAAMQEVSGRDLTQFKRWYNQAGTPVLNVTESFDEKQKRYSLTFEQSCPPSPGQDEKLPMHLPVSVGLLNSEGQDINLQIEGDQSLEQAASTRVLEVTDSQQTFHFLNVDEKPTPSILRHFSTPVRLNFPYSRDRLMFLMSHDDDGFNRWDAGQKLILDVLDEQVEARLAGNSVDIDPRLIEAFRRNLNDVESSPAMLAEMSQLPSVSLLVERSQTVYLDVVLSARKALVKRLASDLKCEFLERRKACAIEEKGLMSGEAMGMRALKNTCMAFLANIADQDIHGLAIQQLEQAQTMTDELAAFRALLAMHEYETAEPFAQAFFNKWEHEELVMEQWFAAQASSQEYCDRLRLQELIDHSKFSIRNPNKVRSVVGAFCGQNWRHFHEADGSGYNFLKEKVVELDRVNPQIASRLLTPLTRWRKYEESRSDMMRSALEEIQANKKLSKDVYEVVSKSLA